VIHIGGLYGWVMHYIWDLVPGAHVHDLSDYAGGCGGGDGGDVQLRYLLQTMCDCRRERVRM
jgi:hypothetical protein